MLRPVALDQPTTPLVTIAEVKAQCEVSQDIDDDDGKIRGYIDGVYSHLSGHAGIMGRCLYRQKWRVSSQDWPASRICRLPFPDASAIDAVKYFDEVNAEQTVSSANYDLLEDERSSLVRFKDSFAFPGVYDDRLDAVQIEFTAGYGTKASDIPASIRTAALLMVCDLYENRGNVSDVQMSEIPMPAGSDRLLQPYRRDII